MNVSDINRKQVCLEKTINETLFRIADWSADHFTSPRPQEPDYVAALSTVFVKEFYRILRDFFPDHFFSVTGVFCHQKPIVDIKSKKMPELGDILFVYMDKDEMICNSLLLQAKMLSKSPLKIPKSEKHQLELYKSWPQFTYLRAGRLNGRQRNILPKTIHNGAQYLLISRGPFSYELGRGCEMLQMGCAIPGDTLYINDSLSGELVNFLKFKSGRTFDYDKHSTEDGWSRMIWDLLEIAAPKYEKAKREKFNPSSFPRLCEFEHSHDEVVCLSMEDKTLFDEISGYHEDRSMTLDKASDEDGGVSVVLIESIKTDKRRVNL